MSAKARRGRPGVTVWANGKLIGEGMMPRTVPVMFSSYGGIDVGHHNGLVVDRV